MKRIVLASAMVALSAFGALAQNASVNLSAALQSQIMTLVPGADLTNLTNAQYAQLVSLFSNSDNVGAGDNPAGAVKAILNAQ
jgi:Spy/CpxP family protein refolding chaperone